VRHSRKRCERARRLLPTTGEGQAKSKAFWGGATPAYRAAAFSLKRSSESHAIPTRMRPAEGGLRS